MKDTPIIPIEPHLLEFRSHGESAIGYLSVAQAQRDIPFEIRRIFWTYYTPQGVTRGRHAHFKTNMVLIAVHGRIEVNVETLNGVNHTFILDHPDIGLFVPSLSWHTMQYSHDAVQIVLTDTIYTPEDYIRSYEAFEALKNAAQNS